VGAAAAEAAAALEATPDLAEEAEPEAREAWAASGISG
jgi:hypothetical protein